MKKEHTKGFTNEKEEGRSSCLSDKRQEIVLLVNAEDLHFEYFYTPWKVFNRTVLKIGSLISTSRGPLNN